MSDKPGAVVPPPVSNVFGDTEGLGWCVHQPFLGRITCGDTTKAFWVTVCQLKGVNRLVYAM